MSSFSLHVSPEALALLCSSIVDNPLIIHRLCTAVHIPDFIPPTSWSPNSPDLNPVDYRVWSVVQEQVYQTPIHDVNGLKQRLLGEWVALDQRIVDYFVYLNFDKIKFKHSYLFNYWIKCNAVSDSNCWLNSLTTWKVLIWYDQAYDKYDISSLAYFLLNHRVYSERCSFPLSHRLSWDGSVLVFLQRNRNRLLMTLRHDDSMEFSFHKRTFLWAGNPNPLCHGNGRYSCCVQ